jgi:hypothetical protein
MDVPLPHRGAPDEWDDGHVYSHAVISFLFHHEHRRAFTTGGVGSINVTIPAQRTSARVKGAGTLTISDIVVAVANGAEKIIGPIPEAYINASGNITVNYSGTSSVTAGAFKLPASI